MIGRVLEGRHGRPRREILAVVRIAEDEFSRLDDVDGIAAAQRLVAAANDRLRYSTREAEGLRATYFFEGNDVGVGDTGGAGVLGELGLQLGYRLLRAAIDQQRYIGLRVAPIPMIAAVFAEVAQNARPRRRGHAFEERERKGLKTVRRQTQPRQAPRT